jgi:hypothetical protein
MSQMTHYFIWIYFRFLVDPSILLERRRRRKNAHRTNFHIYIYIYILIARFFLSIFKYVSLTSKCDRRVSISDNKREAQRSIYYRSEPKLSSSDPINRTPMISINIFSLYPLLCQSTFPFI